MILSSAIKEYTWDFETPLATAIARSYQIREALKTHYDSAEIQAKIRAYFADKPVGYEAVLPVDDPTESSLFYPISPEHKSPHWVPPTTIEFDTPGDLRSTMICWWGLGVEEWYGSRHNIRLKKFRLPLLEVQAIT